jgi:hypothetical protein
MAGPFGGCHFAWQLALLFQLELLGMKKALPIGLTPGYGQ